MAFANKLAILLKSSGKTVEEFANEAGVSEKTLSNYIKGRESCQLIFARRVASIYGVSLDWLIAEEDLADAGIVCALITTEEADLLREVRDMSDTDKQLLLSKIQELKAAEE